MAIKADRGGKSVNTWYQRDLPVRIESCNRELELWLELDSKGGGVTDIRIEVGKASYEALLSGMLECDFDKTMDAFATACRKWRRASISKSK